MVDLLPVSGAPLQRVSAIAGRQRGRVARWQLLDGGISSSAIGRMNKRGLLYPEHVGVYYVVHAASEPLGRETAALLACGERAILSHTSAAAVWGFISPQDGPVEVTLAGQMLRRRRPGIELHRSRNLLQRDVRTKEHLPLTSPARTLLDLAGCLDSRSLERALDEALVVRKLVSRRALSDVLSRATGRRGARPLKALLERRNNSRITHSQAERRCLELIRESGLPVPQTQVKVAGYTVDLLWPEHRVVFEIDGYGFHTSRWAFDRDRRKDIALKSAAFDPNRLSRDQVMFEPYVSLAAIAGALARASERLIVR